MCTNNGCLYSNAGPWNTGDNIKIIVPIDKLPTEEGLDDDNNEKITGEENDNNGNSDNIEEGVNNININLS